MARTQYGKMVRTIRLDNALEFTDDQCVSFFSEQGIVQQTSCVDRPQ